MTALRSTEEEPADDQAPKDAVRAMLKILSTLSFDEGAQTAMTVATLAVVVYCKGLGMDKSQARRKAKDVAVQFFRSITREFADFKTGPWDDQDH